MSLLQRLRSILQRPGEAWLAIDAEPGDASLIYGRHVAVLAVIPPLATFVGATLGGEGAIGSGGPMPLATPLLQIVVAYVLSLVAVYGLAGIVEALAPAFGGRKDGLAALKLVAYASTPAFLGGAFAAKPALAPLGVVAALYGVYLFYRGVPVLMQARPGGAAAYTAVAAVCALGSAVLLGVLTSLTVGEEPTTYLARAFGRPRPSARPASADPPVAGKSAIELLVDAFTQRTAPIPADDLKAALPASLSDLQRSSLDATAHKVMGITTTTATAFYDAGERRVALSIVDVGTLGTAPGIFGTGQDKSEDRTDDASGPRQPEAREFIDEAERKSADDYSRATLRLANGVIVTALGWNVDATTLKSLVLGLDLARLEAMQHVTAR